MPNRLCLRGVASLGSPARHMAPTDRVDPHPRLVQVVYVGAVSIDLRAEQIVEVEVAGE